jgi:hypothetical protein
VVVQDVQDLDVGPVCQAPVGGIALPPLVRHRGLEPTERGPRPLLGLRGDEATAGKNTPDRRDRRRATVATFEVEGDRVRPRVEPSFRQVFAESDDLVLERVEDSVRARPRTSRSWLEPGLTFGLEPPDELMDPPPGDPVVSPHAGLAPPLDQDRRDHQPCQRHRSPPSPEV